eukprot:3676920-Prymnesium_polylepis.1
MATPTLLSSIGASPPPPAFVPPTPALPSPAGCGETCSYSADGDCDDGGAGAEFTACLIGTDCTDCGVRLAQPPPPSPPATPPVVVAPPPPGMPPPPYSTPSPSTPQQGCGFGGGSDACSYASDNECDDGGSGSEYAL